MAKDLTKRKPKKVTFASDQQRPAGEKATNANCVKDISHDIGTGRSSARKRVRPTPEDNTTKAGAEGTDDTSASDGPIQEYFESLTEMKYNDRNLDKHLSSLLDLANMNTKEKQELFWYTRWWQRGRRPNTKDDMKSIFKFCAQKELNERNLNGCLNRWTTVDSLDYAVKRDFFWLIVPWMLERQLVEENAKPSAHGITDV